MCGWQMEHSFCLEAVIVSFCWEVHDIFYNELGALDHWRSMCKGHLPNIGGDCVHIGNPRSLILDHMTGAYGSHCRFDGCLQPWGTRVDLNSSHRQWVPHRQAVTLSKPGGGTTTCSTSRGLGEGEVLLVSPICSCSSALWH